MSDAGKTSIDIPWPELVKKYNLFKCSSLNAWLSPMACRERKRHQLLEMELDFNTGPCVYCSRGGDIETPDSPGGDSEKQKKKEEQKVKIRVLKSIDDRNYRPGDILEVEGIDAPEAKYLLERRLAERIWEKQSVDLDMSTGYVAWPLEKIETNLALKGQLPRSSTSKAQIGSLMQRLAKRKISIFFAGNDQPELRFFPLTGYLDSNLAAIIYRNLYAILQEELDEIHFVTNGVKCRWPSEEPGPGCIVLPVEDSLKPRRSAVENFRTAETPLAELKRCRVAISKQNGFLMLWPPVMPRTLLQQIKDERGALYASLK